MKRSRYHFQIATILACGCILAALLVLPAAAAGSPLQAIGLACVAVFFLFPILTHAEAYRQAIRHERRRRHSSL